MQSPDWRARREELIVAHDSRCALCGIPRMLARLWDSEDLNVDHTNYGNIGCETPDDVQPLCKKCHQAKSFRDDQRKEHLAYCQSRMAREDVDWNIIAWLALIERGRPQQWRDRRAVENMFVAAAREFRMDADAVDLAFARCLRQSLFGAPSVACFRWQAARLRTAAPRNGR